MREHSGGAIGFAGSRNDKSLLAEALGQLFSEIA